MAPEMQVKQYVAVVRGKHGRFMVFETASARHYLFSQLDPQSNQTGLQWPVRKADLRDDVRAMLRRGCGNA